MTKTNQNIEIGIYFVPRHGTFYSSGSKIIGYDIRGQKLIRNLEKENVENFKYGFHLTIVDVIEININKLNKVIKIVSIIVKNKLFQNIKLKLKKIGKMPNADIIAIQYQQNIKLLLLHTALIFTVQRLGINSYYKENKSNLTFLRKIKTRLFLNPYILNDFLPHFSLMSSQIKQMSKKSNLLMEEFKQYSKISIETLCLVGRKKTEKNFTILKEFRLG